MIDVSNSKRGNIIIDLMPDLTPLLDVMFMLIVFFILTANAVPYALDINLPEDTENITQAVEDPNILFITLLPDEEGWRINETHYQSEDDFKQALKEQAQDNKQAIIAGDKDVSMQKLLTVLAFLRKHNIETADIIMQRE